MTQPTRDEQRAALEDRGHLGNLAFELIDDVPDDAENVTIEEVNEVMDAPITPMRSSTRSQEG